MLLINNSLVKTEYITMLMFFIFSMVLTILIISASYFFVKQNPESEKLFQDQIIRILLQEHKIWCQTRA